jgi:hypothetical protein
MAAQESDRGGESREGPRRDEEVGELLVHLLRLVAREIAARLRTACNRSTRQDPGEESAPKSGEDREKTEGM